MNYGAWNTESVKSELNDNFKCQREGFCNRQQIKTSLTPSRSSVPATRKALRWQKRIYPQSKALPFFFFSSVFSTQNLSLKHLWAWRRPWYFPLIFTSHLAEDSSTPPFFVWQQKFKKSLRRSGIAPGEASSCALWPLRCKQGERWHFLAFQWTTNNSTAQLQDTRSTLPETCKSFILLAYNDTKS